MMFIQRRINVDATSMMFIQRRINVDATSWRFYNVGLMSMQRPDVDTTSN